LFDPWAENALRIQADLTRMARWIRSKKTEYVSLDMRDDEASLIQSTVTSFAATTASELETLRKIIPSSYDSNNIASHRAGVVQILFSQLQEQITEPFKSLQRQRTRVAVQLWQNPLQCKLYLPKVQNEGNRSMMEFFDEEDGTEREQRFLPRRQSPPNDYDFMSKYAHKRENTIPSRPEFLTHLAKKKKRRFEPPPQETKSDTTSPLPPKAQLPMVPERPKSIPYQQPTSEESRRHLEEDLQQESALLLVAVHNDLDSVQKTEQRMVEITTLISQFSNLVSEQQEEIWQIHDSARETKENIDKGQENLVDAAEKTKRSRHYLAWTIFAMSMTLLFFQTLRS
jgi:hypothetical protein